MTTTPSGTLTLSFLAPNAPMSENEARGVHWAVSRARLKMWQDVAWAHALNARRRREWPPLVARPLPATEDWAPVPITVQVVLPFRVKRTRDPHNYTSTVVKAIVDGIKRAGIVPDDHAEWVTVLDPILTVNPGPQRATVTIQERTHP